MEAVACVRFDFVTGQYVLVTGDEKPIVDFEALEKLLAESGEVWKGRNFRGIVPSEEGGGIFGKLYQEVWIIFFPHGHIDNAG